MIALNLGIKAPVIRELDRMGKGVYRSLERVLIQTGDMVVRTAKAHYLSGPRPKKLGVVTGKLRGSIKRTPVRRISRNWRDWYIQVYSDSAYARIHELGGKIKPKSGEYLVIPLSKRFRGKSLREVPNTFIRPMKDGSDRFIVFQKYDVERQRRPGLGKGRVVRSAGEGFTIERLTPVAILQKSVKIPKRPFLAPALRDNRARIEALLARSIRNLARATASRE